MARIYIAFIITHFKGTLYFALSYCQRLHIKLSQSGFHPVFFVLIILLLSPTTSYKLTADKGYYCFVMKLDKKPLHIRI